MGKEIINMRKFAKSLRYLSRVELEKQCKNCGMTEREIYGTLAYIYDRDSVENIADYLGISVGKFQYRKEILAVRFKGYLDSIGYKLI